MQTEIFTPPLCTFVFMFSAIIFARVFFSKDIPVATEYRKTGVAQVVSAHIVSDEVEETHVPTDVSLKIKRASSNKIFWNKEKTMNNPTNDKELKQENETNEEPNTSVVEIIASSIQQPTNSYMQESPVLQKEQNSYMDSLNMFCSLREGIIQQ